MAAALTCDTSVVVAALSAWHPHHSSARAALGTLGWLPAHVLAETASVLSRLPNGQAISVPDVVELLRPIADGHVKQLRGDRYLAVVMSLGTAGLSGGAVYDALIAATAHDHGARLLTLDRRAQRTYTAIGAAFQLLDSAP